MIAIAVPLAAGGAGVWLLVSEKQTAQKRQEKFFGTTKEYPTSGGLKMGPQW